MTNSARDALAAEPDVTATPDVHAQTRPQTGRPMLLLHGGGGPATVAAIADHFADTADVFAPTHPGFNGTERPANIDSIRSLADEYARFLDTQNLNDVLVVGSSVGGWLGAELALGSAAHRIRGLCLINATGIDVAGHPIRNISGMPPQELAQYSFHDPSKLKLPAPTPEGIAIARSNAASLDALAGHPYMYDPTLLGRLGGIRTPTLVIWGASDRVVDSEYGRAFAEAIPDARFEPVSQAGHLPHLEQPAAVFALLDAFAAG